MNEKIKTLLFTVAAVGIVALAWATRPSQIIDAVEADLGQPFFPEFQNPLLANSIEIMEFDEDTSMLKPFEVTKVGGLWAIPSHSNYPADAEKQLGDAAASIISVKKLGVVSKSPGDHELYGVVEPDPGVLAVGATGVGKKVVLRNAAGDALSQFIIGKTDPEAKGIRYVRVPGQDVVYKVELDTSKLSTDFGVWIEKDLLKLNTLDLSRVTMDNHSVDQLRGRINQDSRITVDYDSANARWSLEAMEIFLPDDGWVEQKLGPNEELNEDKLNQLKLALGDLRIVDVARKPAGVSADLKAGEEQATNLEVAQSLARRGFFIAKQGDTYSIFSNQGEIRCGTLDGVEYVLRFGDIASTRPQGSQDAKENQDADDGEGEPKQEEDAQPDSGVNRYLMVSAQFNEDLIAKPRLKPLPPLPGSAPTTDKPAANTAPAGDAGPAAEPVADGPAAGEEAPPAEAPQAELPLAAEPAPVTEPALANDPVRLAIIAENQRLTDEYNELLAEGRRRAAELNNRFADWYYVIPNSTYQKIHLSRADLIQKRVVEPGAAGPGGMSLPGGLQLPSGLQLPDGMTLPAQP